MTADISENDLQVFWLFAVIVVAYTAPTIMAFARHHRQRAAIAALNVLLGWTFVGWVVAFVWALVIAHDQHPVTGTPIAEQICRFCKSSISADATVCRFCQRDLVVSPGPSPEISALPDFEA